MMNMKLARFREVGKCGPGMKAAKLDKNKNSQRKLVDKSSRRLHCKMHQNVDEKKQFGVSCGTLKIRDKFGL